MKHETVALPMDISGGSRISCTRASTSWGALGGGRNERIWTLREGHAQGTPPRAANGDVERESHFNRISNSLAEKGSMHEHKAFNQINHINMTVI